MSPPAAVAARCYGCVVIWITECNDIDVPAAQMVGRGIERINMKAILEFSLPEEQEEHQLALDGGKYLCVLQALDNDLRGRIKHGEYPETTKDIYDEVRSLLCDYADEEGVDLHR